MIQTISDILVLSDMDGTLLSANKKLYGANMETIRLFTTLGGRFAVSTGRMPVSVSRYEQLEGCLAPSITCNGCVIYDFQKKQIKKSHLLPMPVGRRVLREVLQTFPALGAIVEGGDLKAYQVNASNEVQNLFSEENLPYLVRPPENLPTQWNKVVFAGPSALLAEVEKFVVAQQYPGISFVASSPVYFEMLPEGINKGSALLELCELLRCPIENTIAIGDYFNDIQLMELAGHSVAMGNAPAEVKLLADELTTSSEEGGVGQYLYQLIKKYA